MKIVTVYRTGGDFTPEYVGRLNAGLSLVEHTDMPTTHVCLTDRALPILPYLPPWSLEQKPLKHNWPGWWSKMEIFREEPPFLYLDLDTIINGSLEPLIERVKDKKFVCIKPIFQDRPDAIASGMLWVNQDMTEYYKEFASEPQFWMATTSRHAEPQWNNGDQRCMELMGIKPDGYWQDLCPGLVAHRKHHSEEERQKASVIWYSGKPRPHETGWAI